MNQLQCVVCNRVRGHKHKTTWLCPQMGNVGVCAPDHPTRKCFDYLQEKGAIPPPHHTVDMQILDRLEGRGRQIA